MLSIWLTGTCQQIEPLQALVRPLLSRKVSVTVSEDRMGHLGKWYISDTHLLSSKSFFIKKKQKERLKKDKSMKVYFLVAACGTSRCISKTKSSYDKVPYQFQQWNVQKHENIPKKHSFFLTFTSKWERERFPSFFSFFFYFFGWEVTTTALEDYYCKWSEPAVKKSYRLGMINVNKVASGSHLE